MSQSDEILRHLKSGKTLTPLEALRRFHCLRLGARCYDLRQDGHDILTNLVLVNGKRVARYALRP